MYNTILVVTGVNIKILIHGNGNIRLPGIILMNQGNYSYYHDYSSSEKTLKNESDTSANRTNVLVNKGQLRL